MRRLTSGWIIFIMTFSRPSLFHSLWIPSGLEKWNVSNHFRRLAFERYQYVKRPHLLPFTSLNEPVTTHIGQSLLHLSNAILIAFCENTNLGNLFCFPCVATNPHLPKIHSKIPTKYPKEIPWGFLSNTEPFKRSLYKSMKSGLVWVPLKLRGTNVSVTHQTSLKPKLDVVFIVPSIDRAFKENRTHAFVLKFSLSSPTAIYIRKLGVMWFCTFQK